MAILDVALSSGAQVMPALGWFYVDRLGCVACTSDAERLSLRIGESTLRFEASRGDPFYHFALLVPGDRFAAAFRWADDRVELLPGEDGATVFPFGFWDATACYFHDPAGNIVELVAHQGVGANGRSGPFGADELVGLSEVGIVGESAELPDRLAGELGLTLWDGVAGVTDRLAFVGEKARTLILASERRPWLPTGRPAQRYPVDITVSGEPEGDVQLDSGGWVRRRPYLV
jgi:hypothetical protein